jgi:hypothetical protein
MPLERDQTGRLRVVPMGPAASRPSRPSPLAALLQAQTPDASGDLSPLEKLIAGQPAAAPEPESDWGDWAAMGLRGAAGFVPGGPLGALAGGVAELGGQLLEGRDDLNFGQIATQAGLGFIPFGGKVKGLLQAGIKGAGHGALGAGATEFAETGELPSLETVGRGALIGGGAGAGVNALSKFLKAAPKAASEFEVGPHVPNKSGFDPAGGFGEPAATPRPITEPYAPNVSGYTPDTPAPVRVDVPAPNAPAISQNPLATLFKPRVPASVVAEAQAAGEPILDSPATARFMRSFEMGNEAMTDDLSDAAERAAAARVHKDLSLMDQDYRRLIADERGQANPDLLFNMGSSAIGATAGALSSDPEDRLQNTVLGGALGAAAPTLFQRLARLGERGGGGRAADSVVDASGRDLGGYAGPERRAVARAGDVSAEDALYERMREKQGRGIPTGSKANRDLGKWKSEVEAFREQAAKDRGEVPLPRTSGGLLANETGSVPADLNFNILSAFLGAGAGAALDPEDRTRGGIAGGLLGAAAPHLVGNPTLERARFAAMLSSPLTHLRNTVGVAGSTAIGGIEKAFEQGDPRVVARTLKELFSPETIEAGKRAFSDPSTTSKVTGPGIATEGPLSVPGRLLGAEDAAGRSALTRAGFSPEDAERRMFAGDPHSETGRALLQFQRTNPYTRFLLPFVRTQTNILEQGLERVDPRRLLNAATPEARRLAAAQLGLSAAAAGGGYLAGEELGIPAPMLAAAMGPYALPFVLGSGAGMAAGDDEVSMANAVASKFQQQIPLVQDYALNPGRVLSSYVPNILRDLNPDDVKRDTTGSVFGPAFAKIPGVSQTLPAKRSKKKRRVSPED